MRLSMIWNRQKRRCRRRGSKKKKKPPHLAEEVIEDILSRLPVKSLLRFRCVSKSWLSLITRERFIKTHLQKSTKNASFSHHRVIFKNDALIECSLHQLLNEASSIEPSVYDSTNSQLYVIGCCNGLICLNKYQSNCFFLWNPATRISIELPEIDNIGSSDILFDRYGFGWDATSGAYKVFAVVIRDLGYVYSSQRNSWETVDRGWIAPYHRNGVVAYGKIHWISEHEYYIESWDLESEEFGRIELSLQPPIEYRHLYHTLAEIGGCLHSLCVDDEQSKAIVWVMKDESVWLKLFTIPLFFEQDPDSQLFLSRPNLFVGGPNGEILVIFPDDFLVYSFKDNVHEVRAGENSFEFCGGGFVYVQSLVSPNITRGS